VTKQGGSRLTWRSWRSYCVESHPGQFRCPLNDLGIARAFDYQVDAHVRAGRLHYVLPEFDPPGVPVSLLFQASRRGSPNVQALIASAQEHFRSGKIARADAVIE
jgi:DNA-binding transcriptional LysR family regulator